MGKKLGTRSLSGAAKIVGTFVKKWNNGSGSKLAGLNKSLRKYWPDASEIYESSDESKIPEDTWNYDNDGELI